MVVANPFASPLDVDGNPCAFVRYDPEHSGDGVRYVGCALDREVTKPKVMTVARPREDRRQYPRIATTVRYDLAPTPIVHSAYHRDLIREGALLAADEATWKLAGCKGRFDAPSARIERDCSTRIAEWLHEHPGETLNPGVWFVKPEKAAPLIRGLAMAQRSPITASTLEDRIDARKAGKTIAEGDGLAKAGIPITERTDATLADGGNS